VLPNIDHIVPMEYQAIVVYFVCEGLVQRRATELLGIYKCVVLTSSKVGCGEIDCALESDNDVSNMFLFAR
jgi:hypothetical protein